MSLENGIDFRKSENINTSIEERQKPVEISFLNEVLIFDYKNKLEKIDGFPENFGEVVPNLIYRGSWPLDVNELAKKNISKIVTIYASNDGREIQFLDELQQQTKEFNIKHLIFDVVEKESYWKIAEEVSQSINEKTYIHCQHGSIRTGIVSFLTELIYKNQRKEIIDENVFRELIDKTMEHGFNYNNEKYRALFEDIVKEATDRKLLPLGIKITSANKLVT